MTVDSFPSYSTHAILPPSGLYHHVLDTQGTDIHKTLWYCRHCRCILGLNFSWSFAPITLTTLYEMMMDLTRRIEMIELILLEYPSSSRGAPGVVMPSLPHLTSPIFVTYGASYPWPCPHLVLQQHSSPITLATLTRPLSQLRDPPVITIPQERLHSHRRCQRHFLDLSILLSRVLETFQVMGFLAPLDPRSLPNLVSSQFRLDLYYTYHQSVEHHTDRCTALRHSLQDLVDSRTFGHLKSDIIFIPTSTQAMHADTPSLVVLDLIDLGDWLMIGLPWCDDTQILFSLWIEMWCHDQSLFFSRVLLLTLESITRFLSIVFVSLLFTWCTHQLFHWMYFPLWTYACVLWYNVLFLDEFIHLHLEVLRSNPS